MLFRDHLVDLDELVVHCYDENTKAFVTEAVNCYRAGSYRAAIVATWIAVVFDLIAKIREIDLTGDLNARQQLTKLEQICAQGNVKDSQDFERDILDIAKTQFELLSPLECTDLKRLHEDRHRCAHPSMHSPEEPFQPTAELARYHIRNAATCLFQHPPVQGKAAKDRIFAEIASPYFPIDRLTAVEHFKHGPLLRARDALVKEVANGLTRDLLIQVRSLEERNRQLAALQAVLLMYPEEGEQALRSEVPKSLSRVPDASWPYVIQFVRTISLGWEALDDIGRDKALRFIQSGSLGQVSPVVLDALHIPSLRESARQRLPELSLDTFAQYLNLDMHPDNIEEAVRRFVESENYAAAKSTTNMLLFPTVSALTPEYMVHIIDAFRDNSQLNGSFRATEFMEEVFASSETFQTQTKDAWISLYAVCYSSFIDQSKFQKNESLPAQLLHLFRLIEQRYPHVEADALAYLQQRFF